MSGTHDRAKSSRGSSAFADAGLKETIRLLKEEVAQLYLSDSIPWVLGYSGGKDSSASLQLVWTAIGELPEEQRTKPVHVITTDTLVENPVVAAWVGRSLETMRAAAAEQGLPIHPRLLKPELADTFWVNLIGKGYPAPRNRFRWCTERLKIKPSNAFIRDVVKANGEALVVLGTRKAESAKRAGVMNRLAENRTRDLLRPNTTLPNCLVYSPIEDWSNDDVWTYLMQVKNPWGHNNKDLLTMYQGASADGDCPLVVDSTTPTCGSSRFGCWVCTLVDEDKSMSAMIRNDEEKEWMLPLLKLRNELDVREDRHLRDFRRLHGGVSLYEDRNVPGPYTQEAREEWLHKLLNAQETARRHGPSEFKGIELISLPELCEIRRIWVVEKHEVEDNLPLIYQEVTGEPFPGPPIDTNSPFGSEEMRLLRDLCDGDRLQFELLRELLDVERRFQTMARRVGLYEALEGAFQRSFYSGEDDALDRARRRKEAMDAAQDGRYVTPAGSGPRAKGGAS